ncbi:hypothetical protein AUP68_05150 [Ilyonectria robusta]
MVRSGCGDSLVQDEDWTCSSEEPTSWEHAHRRPFQRVFKEEIVRAHHTRVLLTPSNASFTFPLHAALLVRHCAARLVPCVARVPGSWALRQSLSPTCPEYVTAGTLVLGYDLHVFSPSHPFEPQVHRMTPLPKASKAIIRKASTCLRYPLGNLSRLSLKRIFLTKRVIAAKSPTELRRRVCGSSTNTTITMTGPARSLGGAPSGPYPCQRALNGSRHGEVEPRRRR